MSAVALAKDDQLEVRLPEGCCVDGQLIRQTAKEMTTKVMT
jgi:hypothetical protein